MTKQLHTQVNRAVEYIGKVPVKDLFDEAENFVCAVCEMDRKPCHIHSGATCAHMIREGTELELLRNVDHAEAKGMFRTCLVCGRPISAKALRYNPLRELCPHCTDRVKRKKLRNKV